MKKVFHSSTTFFNTMCCSIFGHYYAVSKKVTSHIKEYECIHCKKQVTTDEHGNLLNLTPELEDINNTLQQVHNKKKNTTQQVA